MRLMLRSRSIALLAGFAILAALLSVMPAWPAFAQDSSKKEVPARPTGLTNTATHNAVTLTWANPNDNSITHYQVLRREPAIHASGYFVTINANTGSAATTYTDSTVEPETKYVFRVKAVNAAGVSKRSRFTSADTPAAPPPEPTSTPTPTPTPEPTPTQTPEPTPTSTPEPTPTSTPPEPPPPPSDAARDDAIDLGDITAMEKPLFSTGDIDGGDDAVDYFHFTLSEPKEVHVGLRQQETNADLFLEAEDGEVIAGRATAGTGNEEIKQTLVAGTYYVRIAAQEAGDSSYVFRYGVNAPDAAEVARLEAEAPQQQELPLVVVVTEPEDKPLFSARQSANPAVGPAEIEVWSTTMTVKFVDSRYDYIGYYSVGSNGSMADTTFTYRGTGYTVIGLLNTLEGTPTANTLTFALDKTITDTEELALYLNGVKFTGFGEVNANKLTRCSTTRSPTSSPVGPTARWLPSACVRPSSRSPWACRSRARSTTRPTTWICSSLPAKTTRRTQLR